MTVSVSIDGKDFTGVGEFEHGLQRNESGLTIKAFSVVFEPQQARYLRVTAKNIGKIPDYHPAAGANAYLFVDEIKVN